MAMRNGLIAVGNCNIRRPARPEHVQRCSGATGGVKWRCINGEPTINMDSRSYSIEYCTRCMGMATRNRRIWQGLTGPGAGAEAQRGGTASL